MNNIFKGLKLEINNFLNKFNFFLTSERTSKHERRSKHRPDARFRTYFESVRDVQQQRKPATYGLVEGLHESPPRSATARMESVERFRTAK